LIEALTCLALNIYWEARNQSTMGQVAVAQVTINRVMDDRFPDTVCEVVMQGETYSWNPEIPIRNKCQFSWYCDGKSDTPKDMDAWEKARLIAFGTYGRRVYDLIDGATHYHAVYVLPDWYQSKQYITRIDDHVFYRWESE
jgi:spore germination cell wall hydrolase CwlJ-like protein